MPNLLITSQVELDTVGYCLEINSLLFKCSQLTVTNAIHTDFLYEVQQFFSQVPKGQVQKLNVNLIVKSTSQAIFYLNFQPFPSSLTDVRRQRLMEKKLKIF